MIRRLHTEWSLALSSAVDRAVARAEARTGAQPLYDTHGIRQLEAARASGLPAGTLMQRAGESLARLACALAPHAARVWVACGPGHNGADGLLAAAWLQRAGRACTVTWTGSEQRLSAQGHAALALAHEAGVTWADQPPLLSADDLAIDALLGVGARPELHGRLAELTLALGRMPCTVLAADVPTGLDANTGTAWPALEQAGGAPGPRHTLTLLALKPGLFMGHGRDRAGELWWDDLVRDGDPAPQPPAPDDRVSPVAWLCDRPSPLVRTHASHKGTGGDVTVVGGQGAEVDGRGMTGAAWLAARAALRAGAGRVMVVPLQAQPPASPWPELMVRAPHAVDWQGSTLVVGCGGAHAIHAWLPQALGTPSPLVLDADALNAVATDAALLALLRRRGRRQRATVITPHPLEAARLLGCSTAEVQADRLAAAGRLAAHTGCTVVLKGSGTVVTGPGQPLRINPTGNGRLATAGTGDVLAGWIGALLARGLDPLEAASAAVWWHGEVADRWPDPTTTLTAAALAEQAHHGV